MKVKEMVGYQFFRGVALVMEKNVKIYYTKPPVIIFGLLFPFFMFLAFYLGRELNLHSYFPGILAMTLFFTSSSVGPLITPWEKTAGTYERLLSFPINIKVIIGGDVVAGMVFGIIINVLVLVGGLMFLPYRINIWVLTTGTLLASFCFSSLGVLLASPSAGAPSHIMMLSSLIRFPLIFISGIFIPLGNLQGIGKIATYFSPLTYLVDLFNFSLRGEFYISVMADFIALFSFSVVFLYLANRFLKRNLMKGL